MKNVFKFLILVIFTNSPIYSAILEDDNSLKIVKRTLEQIKEDPKYHSYFDMLDDVKGEHSIKYHKPNAPFFYSNDRIVMEDIIKLVMDDPDGIVDLTQKNGTFIVYRDFDYHQEIEELFDREQLYRRIIPEPKKFQNDYLGLTQTGPTNKVGILLRVKGDEQNAPTFQQRVVYTGNNIDFVDAYPMNAKNARPLPPPPAPVPAPTKAPVPAKPAEEAAPKVEEAKTEEAAPLEKEAAADASGPAPDAAPAEVVPAATTSTEPAPADNTPAAEPTAAP